MVSLGRPGVPHDNVHENDGMVYATASWRSFERRWRYRFSVLVAYEHREVGVLHQHFLVMNYILLPSWLSHFEFGLNSRPEIPWAGMYIGTYLFGDGGDEESVWCNIIMPEWIQILATQFLYGARNRYLLWLLEAISEGIREMRGAILLLKASSADHVDLMAALEQMEVVKWSKMASTYRILPEVIGATTPGYAGANWVTFDSDKWEANLPEDIFVREERDGHLFRDSRGLRLSGTMRNLGKEGRPSGVQMMHGSAIGSGLRRSRATRSNLSRAAMSSSELGNAISPAQLGSSSTSQCPRA